MVLIGSTGVGKSALIPVLLNDDNFYYNYFADSVGMPFCENI